jgi:predicted ATP-dependent serine protease
MAREAKSLKCSYFSLDDISENQFRRVDSIPNVKYINYQMFDERFTKLQTTTNEKCQNRAIFEKTLKSNAQIENRSKKYSKELGIDDNTKIDGLLLFQIFIESQFCSGTDLIILDSLNSLLGSESRINRAAMKKIIGFCKKTNKTLIILHHTNKKGEVPGNSALSQVVDTVLQLDKLQGNYRKVTVKKTRYTQAEEECVVRMVSEGSQCIRFEVCEEPKNEQRQGSPLENAILKALGNKNIITFQELSTECNTSDGGIKNCLKNLENKGFISKADGQTWRTIRNCKTDRAHK